MDGKSYLYRRVKTLFLPYRDKPFCEEEEKRFYVTLLLRYQGYLDEGMSEKEALKKTVSDGADVGFLFRPKERQKREAREQKRKEKEAKRRENPLGEYLCEKAIGFLIAAVLFLAFLIWKGFL